MERRRTLKVLWVDDQIDVGARTDLLLNLKEIFERLGSSFEWCDLGAKERIEGLKPDVVFAHFGRVARVEATAYVRWLKDFGCKVIVYSVSTIGFEDADEVVCFLDLDKLTALAEAL